MSALENFADRHGVQFEGTLVGDTYHDQVDYDRPHTLWEVAKAGGRISRVRILQENGLCDISYVHATVGGTVVPVRVSAAHGGYSIPRRLMKAALVEWAQEQGVHAKSLGLLDEDTWSVLHG